MKRKRNAVVCCVLTLVFVLALGTSGFFLVGSYAAGTPNNVLAFLFRFLVIATPVLAVSTLVAVLQVKE